MPVQTSQERLSELKQTNTLGKKQRVRYAIGREILNALNENQFFRGKSVSKNLVGLLSDKAASNIVAQPEGAREGAYLAAATAAKELVDYGRTKVEGSDFPSKLTVFEYRKIILNCDVKIAPYCG